MVNNVIQKRHRIGVRLDDIEMSVIKRIKRYSGSTNLSDSIRQCIRFANVMFDEDLTIENAIIPEMMKVMLNDEEFRKKTPLIHVLKKVHQIEDMLYSEWEQ